MKKRKFKNRLKSLSKYEQTIGDYCFRAPVDSGELIREGKTLSHCVGSARYTQAHASGKTTIIFIRRKSDSDKPFYTMEYKAGHIVQVRGKHNQSATEEVQKVVDQWLAIVNKNYKHA
ncbi:PcfJ-like protein [Streptococcus pyogenes GA06023]|nr:PcfJ-like protein [Streptococcus pyogenes GA06023]